MDTNIPKKLRDQTASALKGDVSAVRDKGGGSFGGFYLRFLPRTLKVTVR